MLTPSKINKELKKLNINGEIVRDSSGYYYFIGDLLDVVPSIWSYNLKDWTMKEMISWVKNAMNKN